MGEHDIPFTPEPPATYLYILTFAERAVVARGLSVLQRLSDAVDRHEDSVVLGELRDRFAVDEVAL